MLVTKKDFFDWFSDSIVDAEKLLQDRLVLDTIVSIQHNNGMIRIVCTLEVRFQYLAAGDTIKDPDKLASNIAKVFKKFLPESNYQYRGEGFGYVSQLDIDMEGFLR